MKPYQMRRQVELAKVKLALFTELESNAESSAAKIRRFTHSRRHSAEMQKILTAVETLKHDAEIDLFMEEFALRHAEDGMDLELVKESHGGNGTHLSVNLEGFGL